MRPRIARSVVAVPPRPREGMSGAHLEDIRNMPCLGCGKAPRVDPHHLQRGLDPKERGMGRRASDQHAIPLCRSCHRKAEATGDDEAVLASWGIDGRGLAKCLWTARGDRKAMMRIVVRSLNLRRIYVS